MTRIVARTDDGARAARLRRGAARPPSPRAARDAAARGRAAVPLASPAAPRRAGGARRRRGGAHRPASRRPARRDGRQTRARRRASPGGGIPWPPAIRTTRAHRRRRPALATARTALLTDPPRPPRDGRTATPPWAFLPGWSRRSLLPHHPLSRCALQTTDAPTPGAHVKGSGQRGDESAVDLHGLASHVRRRVGEQERRHAAQLLGLAVAAQRDLRGGGALDLLDVAARRLGPARVV